MDFFAIVPILVILVYFAVFIAILYLINKWVNKFISLRQEQNDLLREAINKMGNK